MWAGATFPRSLFPTGHGPGLLRVRAWLSLGQAPGVLGFTDPGVTAWKPVTSPLLSPEWAEQGSEDTGVGVEDSRPECGYG